MPESHSKISAKIAAHTTAGAPVAPSCPLHVAIIMDGNGRWAKERGQIRTMGHKAGVEALRRTIAAAVDLGVTHMTVFAFSTENWRRPAAEVNDLMGLLRLFIKADLERLRKDGVRVRIVGQDAGLPGDIVGMIDDAEARTQDNSRFYLQVALNYGAQADIVEAAKAIAKKAAAGELDPDAVTASGSSWPAAARRATAFAASTMSAWAP